MCNFKSAIVLKNKVFMPFDYDAHEQMIKELGLDDKTSSPDFVRVEIIPIDGNIFNHNLNNWQLKVDQDFKPEWFSEKFAKKELRKALPKLFAERFLIDRKLKEIKEGRWFLKNGKVDNLLGNSLIERMWGSSQIGVMRESSQIGEIRDSSQIGAMWDNSRVRVMRNNSWVGEMRDSSQVGEMRESSRIGEMRDRSRVEEMRESSQVGEMRDRSLIINKQGKTPIIYTPDKSYKLRIFKTKKG